MDIKTLINLVREWGTSREIIGANAKATLRSQFGKTIEEVNELDFAILNSDHDGITDGIGDTAVTLIMLSELHGVSFEDCLAFAYNEISSRTGKMVNGTFEKDK